MFRKKHHVKLISQMSLLQQQKMHQTNKKLITQRTKQAIKRKVPKNLKNKIK